MSFLTPYAAFLALLVVAPLAAFVAGEQRRRRVALLLHVGEPARMHRLAPAVAVTAVAGLLGAAATQPTLVNRHSKRVRTDAEAFFVLDTSRSMLASPGPGEPTRFERARRLAERLRLELGDVPTGLASITDRTLPHVFPTPAIDTFETALTRAMGIERPPPSDGFSVKVTTLGSLAHVATDNFFSATARHRLVVVFTDGETKPFVEASLGTLFRNPPAVRTIFVHVWGASERVYLRDGLDPNYRPDPLSKTTVRQLAVATDGVELGEHDYDRLVKQARAYLGSGPTRVLEKERRRFALAPYIAAFAFLPLGFLLWRRNI
ncbi:MAG TPA: hypothetical protein VEL10_06230 [Gaiellaceae bacterium]|nr:hypothetical protein [Gaiellaceae bacterium]